MKALKIVIGILVVVALVYIALAFAGPAVVHVEREAVIEAPVDVVFPEVNTLSQWPNWDPWQKMDSAIVNTYSGAKSGVGCKNSWASKHENVGNGSQEITASVENESITSHMNFDGNGEADATFSFAAEGENTHVKWSIDMPIPFAGRPFMLFMNMDKMLGSDFEKGLASLNEYCKALYAANPPIVAAEVMVAPFWIVSITDTITKAELEGIHEKLYGELGAVLAANKLEMTGNPVGLLARVGRYYRGRSRVSCCCRSEIEEGRYEYCAVRWLEDKAAKTTHLGWYTTLEQTHHAFEAWIAKQGKSVGGVRWEEYEDPALVLPDTAKVTTHLFIPIS
jgi:effector-binding domain-containing protein